MSATVTRNQAKNMIPETLETSTVLKEVKSDEQPIKEEPMEEDNLTEALPTPTAEDTLYPVKIEQTELLKDFDPKKRFRCPILGCQKSYGKNSHLRSHLTWHTGVKPFLCEKAGCGKSFTRSDELARHTRTHTGEKPFECFQCLKKFSRSDHLTKHIATHIKRMQFPNKRTRKEKTVKTTTQDEAITKIKTELNCEKIYPPFEIPMDNITIKKEVQELPKIKQELVENNDDTTILGLAPEKIYNNCIDIKKEIKAEPPCTTGINDDSCNVKQEPESFYQHMYDSDSGEYPCEDWPTTIRKATAIIKATAEAATKAITDSINSAKSQKTQKQDNMFFCFEPSCTKSFKRADDLNRHFRTHTGVKPYGCEECGKRFLRSDHLKKHLETHIKRTFAVC